MFLDGAIAFFSRILAFEVMLMFIWKKEKTEFVDINVVIFLT